MNEDCKMRKCRYYLPSLKTEHLCIKNGFGESEPTTKEQCEQCENYKCKYIEYPLTINGIENNKIDFTGLGHKCGELCEIQICGDEYKSESFIGIYLGDLPTVLGSSFNEDTGILKNYTINNPAIFIPKLKKIVFGYESWWRIIESVDDFKGISEEDINNTWYVQLLKAMGDEENGQTN